LQAFLRKAAGKAHFPTAHNACQANDMRNSATGS
jgi:hypothetical protein